jgi:EAL domain-containing protein (putative c-di-GMP-specific phosphodiesterase class I)
VDGLRWPVDGLRWPAVALLCGLIALHAGVEVVNHVPGDLTWRPMDYAALLFLPVELLALVSLTRAGRRRASITRGTRRRIEAVLAEETLATAFQPIHDLDTGAIVGVEALSRFPGQPPTPPDVWFREAQQIGRGPRLELLALRTALRNAASASLPDRWYVSVNLTPATLTHPALPAELRDNLLDPARVVVELTEHAQVQDYPALRAAIEPLRAIGVRLAVDDAGAGHSSLRHIVDLEPDIIKLDRALVTDIDRDRARRALVAGVVVFALELGSTVIAEGIERQAELDTLRTLAVDGAQGYLLGRPSTDPQQWQRWAQAPTSGTLELRPCGPAIGRRTPPP